MERLVGQAVARARDKPFFWLFVIALVVLLLAPFVLDNRIAFLFVNVVYLRALWVSLASEGGIRLDAKIALWAFWVAAVVLRAFAPDPIAGNLLYVASRLCTSVVLVACVVVTIRHVLHETEVTVDSIFAAIVAYVLAALAFAAIYSALYAVVPASFHFPDSFTATKSPAFDLETIYFSFVTIATLGYGDITPQLPLAQMLVVCESMFGQFYVAVVLAWLVSNYAKSRQQ